MSPSPAPAGPLASPDPWNLVAADYALEVVPLFETFARAAIELALLPDRARVVDVASGPGTLSLLASALGAEVTAIDFSPAMIEQLQRRSSTAGAGIDARVGDGQALPLGDGTQDAAFSMFGLIFFADRAAGFRELFRVLRPGRRAVVSSWGPLPAPYVEAMTALRALRPELPAGDPTAALGDPSSFTAELSAAGFRHIEIHPASYVQRWPSAAALWESMQRTMAPIALMKHGVGDGWAPLATEVAARLHQVHGDDPIEISLDAYLGVGVH